MAIDYQNRVQSSEIFGVNLYRGDMNGQQQPSGYPPGSILAISLLDFYMT